MTQTRYGIVGTAPSWKKTPWGDTGIVLGSLNDAYQLQPQGFQRADEWYDPHPLDKFFYPEGQGGVFAHQVPPGFYVRPKRHLDWIKEQQIPVYLHPDYATQHPEAATWPHCKPFPRDAIVEHFGQYFTSTPQWMMAYAMMRGFVDFEIYGIHLATEQEYREQRPGFEFLIGRLLGSGKIRVHVKDGMRHYETGNGHVALPEESPVLQSKFQYAFETRPSAYLAPLQWELHKLSVKRDRAVTALAARRWWQPLVVLREPQQDGTVKRRVCSTSRVQKELQYLNAMLAETQQDAQRLALKAGV